MTSSTAGSGTAGDPWILATPPGKSDFEAWREPDSEPPALVVQVGTTQLRYQLRCLDDLQQMLEARGDWAQLIEVVTELTKAVRAERAAGTEATDPRMIELMRQWRALIDQFTGVEDGIRHSLARMYTEHDHAA